MASKIEWTEQTWNPVTGCTRVSKGCDNCYAVAMTRRLAGMELDKYAGLVGKGHFNGTVKCHDDVLNVPLRRKIPTTFFVNSMSDLFHCRAPFEFIDKVFAIMAECPQHKFQILTKRPERMAHYFDRTRHREVLKKIRGDNAYIVGTRDGWPLPNVWLGTSLENQAAADHRIPHLLKCPAAVRFLSCEPLLGPIDLCKEPQWFWAKSGVHWIIVGGESGPGARPMHPDWAKSIRDQCVSAGVPFFFKQWGAWQEPHDGVDCKVSDKKKNAYCMMSSDGQFSSMVPMIRVGKKAAGRMLDGRTWDQMPQARRSDG